ncbi:MAG: sigma-54 dependent transcriptional regulator [Planctomycetota bacterium]
MKSLFQIDNVHFVIGVSQAMQDVHRKIMKASRTDLPILVTGETGVGKEITARLIHLLGYRKNNPFVKVNCASLSPGLIESELFGYEKGAFTGAEGTHLGRLEIANGGTFLLDEIDEMDIRLQAKLLRVVEDKCFERVGSSFPQKIDVRFISTCNKNIADALKDGRFRADLYYRLGVIAIYIPPLRSRREDVAQLVNDYLGRHPGKRIHEKSLGLLLDYDWPGNVRELFNILDGLFLFVDDECIMPEHITALLSKYPENHQNNRDVFVGLPLSDIEKESIVSTLSHFAGDVQKASRVLGITDRTLRNKIKQYAINNERGLRKDVIYG